MGISLFTLSPALKMSLFGTFENVATQEATDFFVKAAGYPKEMADGFVGKKTTMKIVDLGDGRIASHTTIEGHPEMNSCCITEAGIKAVTTINGQSFTECWKRVVNITGLYKYKCGNGIVEYMKKAGYPDAIAANIEDYKMAIKACDTGLKVWESWGEVTATFSCTFDQETSYKMPFEGAPDAKVVVTHNGPGKYTWVVKAEGAAEC